MTTQNDHRTGAAAKPMHHIGKLPRHRQRSFSAARRVALPGRLVRCRHLTMDSYRLRGGACHTSLVWRSDEASFCKGGY